MLQFLCATFFQIENHEYRIPCIEDYQEPHALEALQCTVYNSMVTENTKHFRWSVVLHTVYINQVWIHISNLGVSAVK